MEYREYYIVWDILKSTDKKENLLKVPKISKSN